MDPEKSELHKKLAERFTQLPDVVQHAITSADVEKHLRELADTHKLHIDQWDLLENEVMLTLLGFQSTESLAHNIEKEVGVNSATASALAGDISKIVFEPIRQELERELDHPAATEASASRVDDMRAQTLAAAQPATAPNQPSTPATPAAPIAPGTPPPPKNTAKVERAPLATSYSAPVASHERKGIEGDPYREQIA